MLQLTLLLNLDEVNAGFVSNLNDYANFVSAVNSIINLTDDMMNQKRNDVRKYCEKNLNILNIKNEYITLPEESSFFTSIGNPFPAVCIRTSTERPEALDKGCFIISGIDTNGLLQAVDTAVEMVKNGDNGIPVPDYVDENVSDKVVMIIQSYTGIVNKMVWRKEV